MQFDCRVSVIVPIYNQEQYLERAVESLVRQTMPASDFEILLIDDGSTDASPVMCDIYASMFDNIRVVHKANGGLSDARNCGIDHARGKYLLYLDSDDTLQEDTLLSVADFFDKHYDEIDLVTYPCMKDDGVTKTPLTHYRYNTLKRSGVYDLSLDENIYAAVTQIYVCVKNLGEDNVRFSSDRDFRHEDQKYVTDVILRKLKVGFCDQGAYNYDRQPDGLTGTHFYSYYLFEKTMAFWEEEFAKYDGPVPRYLQALYVSDLAWKTTTDILLPYHYPEDDLKAAKKRIADLLERVDSSVIAGHPILDKYQVAFFLNQKPNSSVRFLPGKDTFGLMADDHLVYYRSKMEIILLRTSLQEGELCIQAYLKSPCFLFEEEQPVLLAEVECNGAYRRVEVPLRESSWNYYKAKNKTHRFWDFSFNLQAEEGGSLSFLVKFGGETFKTNYYFGHRAIFSNSKPKRYVVYKHDYEYRFRDNAFYIKKLNRLEATKLGIIAEEAYRKHDLKIWLARKLARRIIESGREIWLYHDCHGVEKNNGYFQFIHDFEIEDGVERYYIVNDPLNTRKHLFTEEQFKHVLKFGSREHKTLFLAANKIITAYIERNNYMPFGQHAMAYYEDLFRAEIVYLQHGVLHAHTPWKYSLDRLLIDKEVVSTQFEIDNLCENYCFDEEHLIPAGMPRYDFIDSHAQPKRKILLAPSWRKFLVRQRAGGEWVPVPSIFENSQFYQQTIAFLTSPRLLDVLEKYDYTLELKLHPILAELYNDFFNLESERVRMAASSVADEEYAVFMTDFSSYRFDFVYLKRPIIYFLPDEDMYKSGMCDYRETDLPLDGTFGDMARTADEAIQLLEELLENDCRPKPHYVEQMEGFFLYDDFSQRDRIYNALRDRAAYTIN